MTFIANPIYDAVFKFMMEDEKVARLLLSALLKKEIIELHMRQHEYTSMHKNRISLFRMDFSALIRDRDGSEHLVLIELQKTWLATETLRFRQYLATQYNSTNNMQSDDDASYGLPIISIYILGHMLGDLKEPVIYVRRQYLDYDDQLIDQKDPFVESLTHDSIIVQIPYLKGRTRNRLERLLNVFDQNYCTSSDEHILEIDESLFMPDEQMIVNRLLIAGVAPDVRREMQIEDEILSEIEKRDTAIMQRDQMIEQRDQVIEQKDLAIEQKDLAIEQKDLAIEQKDLAIEQKDLAIEQKDQVIERKDLVIEQKDQAIEQKDQIIEQQNSVVKKMVRLLTSTGLSVEEIAQQLSISISDVRNYIS